ncbi:MAG: hypothetical protein FD139_670 [Methylocystaceae bacterium]|nr:MAG: hypothetical protein FD148_2622 [Methylocystaceae bacterium]KAF0209961.1 MAG: hypothetical protein FD172_3018 [Methylocystaceae bacterium]TXT46825.1 MAG: hypothetical protein FD139_670 [Methylocystaceae bacterium]
MAAVIFVTEQSGAPFSKNVLEMDVADDPQVEIPSRKTSFLCFCKGDCFPGAFQFPRLFVCAKDFYWTLIPYHFAEKFSIGERRIVSDDDVYVITANNGRRLTKIFDRVSDFYSSFVAFRSSIPSLSEIIDSNRFENPSGLASNSGIGRLLGDDERPLHVMSLLVRSLPESPCLVKKTFRSDVEARGEQGQKSIEKHQQGIRRLFKKLANPITFFVSSLIVLFLTLTNNSFAGISVLVWGYGGLSAIIWFGMLK